MSPTRTRKTLAAGSLALAALFVSSAAAAGATEAYVVIELTMRGCSGQVTLVVDGVRGTGVNGVATEAVSWSDGETITTAYFIGATPTIRLEREGRVLFSAIAEDPEEAPGVTPNGQSFLEATLDCSSEPFAVLSINRGTVVLVPDSAMSRHGPPLQGIGLVLVALSLVVWVAGRVGGRSAAQT